MVAIVTVVQTILPNRLLHLLQILVHHWKMFGISISLVLLQNLYFECRCRIFVGSTKWKRCLHKSILIFDWVGSAYQELNMQSKMCFGLILPAKECHIASSVQQILNNYMQDYTVLQISMVLIQPEGYIHSKEWCKPSGVSWRSSSSSMLSQPWWSLN